MGMTLKCKTCSEELSSVRSYCEHVQRHKKKQIPCAEASCLGVFGNRKTFTKHLASHFGQTCKGQGGARTISPPEKELSLRCSHCKIIFTQLSQFKKHVKQVFQKEKIDCPICHKTSMPSYDAFRMHWKRDHADNVVADGNTSRAEANYEGDVNLGPELDLELDLGQESDTESHGEPALNNTEELGVHQMRDKMASDIVAEIAQFKCTHGIAGQAFDKIIGMFSEAAFKSDEYMAKHMKRNISEEQEKLDNIISVATEGNILHHILTHSWLATTEKRQTRLKKEFHLLDTKNIFLGHNDALEKCHQSYMTPSEVLARFFEDKSACRSFWNHHQSVLEKEDGNHSDFFSSIKFKKTQLTLSENEYRISKGVPLCIAWYR